jgi:hypothetical protein
MSWLICSPHLVQPLLRISGGWAHRSPHASYRGAGRRLCAAAGFFWLGLAFISGAFVASMLKISAWHGSLDDHFHTTAAYRRRELLLQQLVEECAKREDSVITLDSARRRMVVQPSLDDDTSCPLLDIALRGSERGVGMCTDVSAMRLSSSRTGMHRSCTCITAPYPWVLP